MRGPSDKRGEEGIGMRILVIPDVHLKPRMFSRASELMKEKTADRAVCLMDIPDDWNRQFSLEWYVQTFDAAVAFAREYPDTLWCWGNHDVCYLWDRRESGYSAMARRTVCGKLRALRETERSPRLFAFVHRIDGVLFSHGGLAEEFVRRYVPAECCDDADAVVNTVNALDPDAMWQELSPIWYRPQNGREEMYGAGRLLQMAGHTPVSRIERKGNVIFCDVFSTYRDGSPIGTREFLLLDTVSLEYRGIR